ncbi:Transcriptional regulator, MarR family [Georgfuchsia toluolica]|uniref:Transcriptional regulator, MarR family n=1 Tax=Georgfuchsia toluolica TaxID=424218 RepID=A0A916J4D3_9PROT|nr:MarR family winged helix-turn-helix transcriptional regulator [Georgfuchsia toluolica]CAG4883742.1 Transcriptional regulator, MarR family [Georgfuchsia toluolica]
MARRKEQQLPLRVLKKFRLIYGSVRQHFRRVEENCGISGLQLWLLQEIAKTPGAGVSELADRLFIHQSTCSQLVEKLAVRRLVLKKRSKEDLRRVGLVLSATAKEILQRAPGPAEGILPEALSALSEDVLTDLDASLSEVTGQLRVRDEKLSENPLSDL